jgi:[ribosomal protein S18]-alanine N-acetyltransferase
MAEIRPVTADDLDTVVVLELEVFSSRAWSPRSVEEEFVALGETRQMWLAEVADDGRTKAVGYAVGRYVDDVADLQRVAVLPSRRRLGIGRDLVDRVVGGAKDRGCSRVLLEVAADNIAAIALYEGDGFREIDRRPRYYGGDVDAVIMQRELGGEPPDG